MMAMTEKPQQASAKPFVLITGAAGDIGSTLTRALRDRYQIIALDRSHSDTADFSYTFDLTKRESVQLALREVSDAHGHALAAVVHLAAYFDFTGEHSPLYDSVNIEGTRHLLEALEPFTVERFIYSSTMLDRKSTRLNSSHVAISYAVFCLKKKTPRGRYVSYWIVYPI